MTRRAARSDAQARKPHVVGVFARAAAGVGVLAAASGVAVEISRALAGGGDHSGPAPYLLRAVLTAVMVVPTLAWWWRRRHTTLDGMGAGRPVVGPATLGVGVAVGTGAITWVSAAAAGWIRLDDLDPARFAVFVVVVGAALMLFEALPEEIALRGWAWSTLRERLGPGASTVVVTAVFPFVAALSSAVSVAASAVVGTPTPRFSWFPDDPVAYIVQLVVFGLVLISARTLPMPGALWVGIGFHWGQLIVTRIVLWPASSWMPTGWTVTVVQPDAVALVLVHLVLAGAVFLGIRRHLPRHPREVATQEHQIIVKDN